MAECVWWEMGEECEGGAESMRHLVTGIESGGRGEREDRHGGDGRDSGPR